MFAAHTSVRAIRAPAVAKAARNTVVCAKNADRRELLAVLGSVPAMTVAGNAWALIPDDDDEEMVEKAKANRSKRIQQDKETSRQFVSDEGVRNRSIEQNIVPVQKAVYKLAKVGEELEKSDVKAAGETLSDGWVTEFQTAANALSISPGSQGKLPTIISGIQNTNNACQSGDLNAAKVAFVSTVQAIEGWVVDAGIASQLKGL